LQRAALEGVDPAAAVNRHLQRKGAKINIAGTRYDLDAYERVFVVGGGKATVALATAVAGVLGDFLTSGIGVTKYGHAAPARPSVRPATAPALDRIEVIEAGHPVPDHNSVRGARAIVDLASQATERDLIICLISGGGSALLTLPVPGLELAELQSMTEAMLRSGATIGELNTVRKHWSQIKGGGLARVAAPATVITLILSDVVGDPLDVIASGPTVADPTTVADAEAVLGRYGIAPPLPVPFRESPKPGDAAFKRVLNVVIGSNRLAAVAAADKARELGYAALLLGTYVEGEAREVAKVAAGLAKGIRMHGDPMPPSACLIWGGETTVTVHGAGIGGRNTELALSAAVALEGWPGILLMALATDGTDGPTDAAGAIVTGETVARARALGLDPLAALAENDSYTFFNSLGDLIRTGPTGTNVNDLLFILVAAGPG
jgi:hydroxypyruvate reductase